MPYLEKEWLKLKADIKLKVTCSYSGNKHIYILWGVQNENVFHASQTRFVYYVLWKALWITWRLGYLENQSVYAGVKKHTIASKQKIPLSYFNLSIILKAYPRENKQVLWKKQLNAQHVFTSYLIVFFVKMF